ncbi:MAG TPA: type 1 glutamine amidotransferase domain-containing protein [Pseudonocardiaceae bacterium]|nr:type 1 glutamine amidotransferase domain-containing protein [Pseudonocardiaceae bacterium]
MTKAKTLGLLDGRQHPSGFWAEEFVVPYERFLKEGFQVDVATVDGEAPTVDASSLTIPVVRATRPEDSPDHDAENVAHFSEAVRNLDVLKHPMNVGDLTEEAVAGYDACYISGGHGAMEDLPHSADMTRVVRWLVAAGKPLAVVCHGQSALLPLRDSQGRWALEGYRMTAFSHDEELVTDMAGQLPFVLQVELQRLGAEYTKADKIWGSCVVTDRNLITGQNPYSSTAIAETLIERLG